MNTHTAESADTRPDWRKSRRSMANQQCVEVAAITIPTTA